MANGCSTSGKINATPRYFSLGSVSRRVLRALLVNKMAMKSAGLPIKATCWIIANCRIRILRSSGVVPTKAWPTAFSDTNCNNIITMKQHAAWPMVGSGSLSRNKCRNHSLKSKRSDSRKRTSSLLNCSTAHHKASMLYAMLDIRTGMAKTKISASVGFISKAFNNNAGPTRGMAQ